MSTATRRPTPPSTTAPAVQDVHDGLARHVLVAAGPVVIGDTSRHEHDDVEDVVETHDNSLVVRKHDQVAASVAP